MVTKAELIIFLLRLTNYFSRRVMFQSKRIPLIFVVLSLLLLTGCVHTPTNMSSYNTDITEKFLIPDICKNQYINKLPTIAVMDFTNNSTFGKAEVVESKTTRKGGALAGVIISNQGVGLGGVAKSAKKTVNVKRQVDAKLSETLTPLLEAKISQLSGISLVTRNDIEKINKELQLQDSGLVDENTTVQVGKLLGAKFIVTGSIDNIEINQRENEGAAIAVNNFTSRTENVGVQVAGLIGRVFTSFTDGILIKTTVTVKILDVQTGEIVFVQTINDDVNIGKFSNPSYDVYIGGIKAAIINSLEEINYSFSKSFTVAGYITKIRTSNEETVVQVNLGHKHKIKLHDTFKVFTYEQSIDPFTHKQSCDKLALPITLEATEHINDFTSWLKVTQQEAPLKLLLRVEKQSNEENLFALPSF